MKVKFNIAALILCMAALFAFQPVMAAENPGEKKPANWYDGIIFKENSFVFELVRALGHTHSGGSDIGECFATARNVKDGDEESWYTEWTSTARRIYNLGEKYEKESRDLSAKSAYLRASNYFRCADFFMRSPEYLDKGLTAWANSRESFLRAIKFMPYIRTVEIPYEGKKLPGYFLKSPCAKEEKPPLIITHVGFDGTGEELYFIFGKAAVEHGYNVLIFEGPGQGAALRKLDLHFRPDWEKVVTPVVDFAIEQPEVDPDRIALIGYSMGGYLAPRAAAFEHRLKACVANGGVYDFAKPAYASIGPEGLEALEKEPDAFNRMIYDMMKKNVFVRWFYNNGMYAFGVDTPAELMLKMKDYTMKDVIKKIKCSTLVIDSVADNLTPGQAKQFYDDLECPKKLLVFDRESTAQSHCQMGAEAIATAGILNWLDEIFEKKQESE